MVAEVPHRPYHSPRREHRAQATQVRIIAAATAAFLDRGYLGTTLREVARAAGVALPTVELRFGTKATLLKVAIDVAIAGDDEPVPVLARPWAAAALAEPSADGFLRQVGLRVTTTQERAAGLLVAAYQGAGADRAVRELVEAQEEQRERTATWIVAGLAAHAALRSDLDRRGVVDRLWLLLDPVLYHRLRTRRSWSPEQIGEWFIDAVQRLLLDQEETP